MTRLTPAERVFRFATREQLFRRAKLVLVAVSGGPDSVACLLTLKGLRERFGFEVGAIHFDHQLRADSGEDMAFVRALCEAHDIPCFTGEGDVRGSRRRGESLEAAARRMRYGFAAFVAAEKRADAIATGHTAGDQAETVLLRLLRGTGVRGIRAMLPRSGVPGAGAQQLVRPLLCLTRDDTEAICAGAGVEPRRDPTNAAHDQLRNRVRLELLPLMRELNPSVDEALTGLAGSAREAFALVEQLAHGAQPRERTPAGAIFRRADLRGLPAEAWTLVIEREAAFHKREAAVNRRRLADLARILTSGSGLVRFGEVVVEASCGAVRLGPELAVTALEPRILNVPGATTVGDIRVDVSTSPLPASPGAARATLHMDALATVLRVRALQPGDRMVYHGLERKVPDALVDARIPVWDRRSAIAIAGGDRVLAVLTAAGVLQGPEPAEDDALYVRIAAAAMSGAGHP